MGGARSSFTGPGAVRLFLFVEYAEEGRRYALS